jgi:hypothetical protein
MQSHILALLTPKGGPVAAMLVRRANGELALQHVDSRIAQAHGEAANRLPIRYPPGHVEIFGRFAAPRDPLRIPREPGNSAR